jgi:hypothetical protein
MSGGKGGYMDLDDYLQTNAKPVCKVCAHPAVDKINKHLKIGGPLTRISQWTRTDEDGKPYISKETLRRHRDTHGS